MQLLVITRCRLGKCLSKKAATLVVQQWPIQKERGMKRKDRNLEDSRQRSLSTMAEGMILAGMKRFLESSISSALQLSRKRSGRAVDLLLNDTTTNLRMRNIDAIAMTFVTSTAFLQKKKALYCVSLNATHAEWSEVTLHPVFFPAASICKWKQYTASCAVVQQPVEFALSTLQETVHFHTITFKEPAHGRYDVVACFAPINYAQNWQLLLAGLEIRRTFGVALQILYVESIEFSLMNILKVCFQKIK
ncbi:unnamed protein product [Gongylonema pulchrum]|uniref:Uncharacterized protein n=1 Tax=Gongylonema pulchrum TaxID=637853 RepID=A0A183CUM0_9BILA|nr:unnamed protein product [Gongylonema pulchrum]